ncbi:MAG: selenium metabolism-associated LysR family transcriptional regulator [Lachnospirales bacterium]
MDFKQLQSYVACVKYKSLTIAAEKLGISQPTISIHLKALEDSLSTRLINRSSKSFEITTKGQEFYDCAQNILKLRDDLITCWSGEEANMIRLGVSTIHSSYILPEIIPEFNKLHNSTFFNVEQKDSQIIIDGVQKGNFEIGLVGMAKESDFLTFDAFYQDRIVVVTPYNEKFLKMQENKENDLLELLKEPIILREKGSGTKRSIDMILEKMGVEESKLNVVANINNLESIKNLVAGGLGISIISEKAIKDYVDDKKVIMFEIDNEFAKRNLYIVYQKNFILKKCVTEFIEFLIKFYNK